MAHLHIRGVGIVVEEHCRLHVESHVDKKRPEGETDIHESQVRFAFKRKLHFTSAVCIVGVDN